MQCEEKRCLFNNMKGGCEKRNISIGADGKCAEFEKGFLYYWNTGLNAFSHSNFVSSCQLTDDLRIGIYIIAESYHLQLQYSSWGLEDFIGLVDENDNMLNRDGILAREMDESRFKELVEDFQNGKIAVTHHEPEAEPETKEYGWLSPTGEFVKSPFGTHDDTAREICDRKGISFYEWKKEGHLGGYRDLVSARGWCLIHDPTGQGGYIVTHTKPLTKAQREFLYGYFTDMGDSIKAKMYMREEED